MHNEAKGVNSMSQSRFEELFEQMINRKLKFQDYLQKHTAIAREQIDSSDKWFPQTNQLILNHLDILLNASKNILVVFSSVLVGSIALKADVISNVDLDLIRTLSAILVVAALFSMIFILRQREKAIGDIMKQYLQISKFRSELRNVETKILEFTNPLTIENVKNEFLEKLNSK